MKDRIEVFSPHTGVKIGELLWYRDFETLGGEEGYFFVSNGAHALGSVILIYLSGLAKTFTNARRRQNQK